MFLQRFEGQIAKLVVTQLFDCHADDGDFFGQEFPLPEREESRQDLTPRQIAGSSEEHERQWLVSGRRGGRRSGLRSRDRGADNVCIGHVISSWSVVSFVDCGLAIWLPARQRAKSVC